VRPAHGGQRRWLILVVVVGVLVGLAIAARSPGTSAPGGPPLAPASLVGAPEAESSAWYCTGQSTTAGQLAPGSVILTNTGTRTVRGTIDGVTDTGATVTTAVAVAARRQLVADIPTPKSGTWISEAVMLSGGGVAVSQTLQGSSGWAEAPCQSSTSQQWYFPSGVTTGSNALFISLFNPTSTPDVVDLTFTTAKGVVHPINFQGIVLQSGQTQVESVAPFVQDQGSVATTVSTRTGRLVASELQVLTGNGSGLAIVPGTPRVERAWAIPQASEVSLGASSIDVFNPGPTAEEVTVRTALGSGQLSPFRDRVPADSTWVLSTSTETRIPVGDPYSAVVEASGGPGVVVGRTFAAPSTAAAPQEGEANAVDVLSAATRTHTWVVPSPGLAATPVVPGAFPTHLALTNLTARSETYVIDVVEASGLKAIASGDLAPSATFRLDPPALGGAGLDPVLVRTDGSTAVSEDVGPTGGYGVVTMPGVALSQGTEG
jgi:Family of unknown function (DUF5719)